MVTCLQHGEPHFSTICQTYTPLNLSSLPSFLPAPSPPPRVSEFEVFKRILTFKTNRALTPHDLPMPLVKEFAIELAYPFSLIINAAIQSGRNPSLWKHAYVTPIPKITTPMTFGDLRPLALTLFISLLCESFVTEWLYEDIAPNIDPNSSVMSKGHPPHIT